MSLRVVHISPTPLVGAPAKIAEALRCSGVDSLSIALNDYPKGGPLANKFVDDMLVLSEAEREVVELVEESVRTADVIHLHNDLPANRVQWLRESACRAAFVYHVHSPLREGPLYADRPDSIGLPFRAYLVVAQYQPRHYPRYRPVPNIVLHEPSVNRRQPGEKLKVLFSPSHTRAGRWNAKYSEKLEKILRALHGMDQIEVVWPEKPIHPNALMALRRRCHVTIDEIVTGAFHQVSIEGLCAGNVVINRADYFSKAMMASSAAADMLPPFVYADDDCIGDVLLQLSQDEGRVADLQEESYRYFERHLVPHNLAKVYLDVYAQIV